MNRKRLSLLMLLAATAATAQDPLRFSFDGRRGQVEVGGRYAAAEFHRSRAVPSRISFYTPAANSIDLSTDYWKRDESVPLAIRITAGAQRHDLTQESWGYDLSPHTVTFRETDGPARMSVTYEFGEDLPTLVVTVAVINAGQEALPVEIVSHLALTLRTCQTYARLDSSAASVEGAGAMIVAAFTEPEARKPSVFVRNLAATPSAWSTDAVAAGVEDGGGDRWTGVTTAAVPGRHRSAALFRYGATVRPGDTLRVVQAIGSTSAEALPKVTQQLDAGWKADLAAFDARVRRPGGAGYRLSTGDPWIDRAAAWSAALVEANQHDYMGSLVPMPCPAEYNFVFTHDILLSGLGIVNVDAERVRRDLLWVAGHADGTNIPHACYWRDSSFQTEYCTPSNWNHLWFVLLSARYMRFTHDTATGVALLPFVERSVRDLITQVGPDGLVHAPRPDWWDIGWRDGPRAYLTALLSRALDEYVVLRVSVGRTGDSLSWYEEKAGALRRSLSEHLWNEDEGYLLDRNGADLDRHIYAGPLVAAAYGVLPASSVGRLVRTAERRLLAPGVGIRAVMPPDFDVDSVRTYYDIKDHEAGAPYRYINGGVWPHMNAWYAVALQAAGRTEDAKQFFRAVMTVDGVAAGPAGVPAMYEYRVSDASSPEYGTIDKPSFLWAGGFNLYALYRLAGVRDEPWNQSFAPASSAWPSFTGSWVAGGRTTLTVRDGADKPSGIVCDGEPVPSYVLPLDRLGARTIDLIRNAPANPVLAEANALVKRVRLGAEGRSLTIECSSFASHATRLIILSPHPPRGATVDGRPLKPVRLDSGGRGARRWLLNFSGSSGPQRIVVNF